jgi:ATP-dependent Clp protease adaptor protein ClpS
LFGAAERQQIMSDNAGENSDTAVVAPPPKVKVKPKNPRPKRSEPTDKPAFQPPYAVVVLNDNDHTYAYVIDTLCRVCHHTTEKAFKLAQQIDRTGRAAVWTGTLELAELKRDQIRGMGPDFYAKHPVTYPLGVVLEPMPQ